MYLSPDLPRPIITRTNQGFWLAAAAGRLDVQQCDTCHWHRHPPSEGCHRCGSLDWSWDTLSGLGSVYTYTWVHHAVDSSLQRYVPYNVAIVEMEGVIGGGVRLISNVIDAGPDALVIGLPVEVIYEHVDAHFAVPRFRIRT